MDERLLKALGVESGEQYVDTKAKFLVDELREVMAEAVEAERNNEAGNIYQMAWKIRRKAGAAAVVAGGTELDELMNALEHKYGKDLIRHVYGDHNAEPRKGDCPQD